MSIFIIHLLFIEDFNLHFQVIYFILFIRFVFLIIIFLLNFF